MRDPISPEEGRNIPAERRTLPAGALRRCIETPFLSVLLGVFCLFPPSLFPGALESYIRKNYVIPDRVYDFAPANQYKNLGRVSTQHLIPRCPGDIACRPAALRDGIFLIRHDLVHKTFTIEPLDQMKNINLKDYRDFVQPAFEPGFSTVLDEAVFEDLTVSGRGDFLFFRYDKLDRNSTDLTLNDLALPRPFFQGFVRIFKGRTMRCDIEIASEDPETGGYQRTLWDVFRFNGKEHLLIFKTVYESDNFEAFEISQSGFKKVLEFGFGGL